MDVLNVPLEVEALVHCPICGEPESQLVLTEPDVYIPLLRLMRCVECKVIYLNPRLTLASIVALENASEVYNFSRDTAEEQINTTLTDVIRWLEASFVRTSGRRLLDLGCNRGLLMEAARRQGWQVTGVEISPKSASQARNEYRLTVYSTLDEVPAMQRFDLIMAWHVLEHTLAPVVFLRQAAERLTPEGILAIQVPSFDYLNEFRKRDRLSDLLCAVHNFYFTYDSIQTVLDAARLKLVYLDNDPESLLLTAICTTSMSYLSWLHRGVRPTPWWALPGRAWHILRRSGWDALRREVKSYLRWRFGG
jgi:SAM-dependent methyltransferase